MKKLTENNFTMYDLIYFNDRYYTFVSYTDEIKEYGYFEAHRNYEGCFFRYNGHFFNPLFIPEPGSFIPEEYVNTYGSKGRFKKIKISDIIKEINDNYIEWFDINYIKRHKDLELIKVYGIPGMNTYGCNWVGVIDGKGIDNTKYLPIEYKGHKRKGNGKILLCPRKGCYKEQPLPTQST